jgi:hypothetical protein
MNPYGQFQCRLMPLGGVMPELKLALPPQRGGGRRSRNGVIL